MRWWIPTTVLLVSTLGCMGGSADMEPLEGLVMEQKTAADAPVAPAAAPSPAMEAEMEEELAFADDDMGGEGAVGGLAPGGSKGRRGSPRRAKKEKADAADKDVDGVLDEEEQAAEGEDARTRAWFPESFLWQPLVLTDDDGVATVDVRVPDQLTTWRILGLAHDRAGHQTGAVHSFDSRLPLYVDPVVPGWLYAGDQLQLPIQVVNTTDAAVSATLTAQGSSALQGAGQVALPIGPADSNVVDVRMTAVAAGTGVVSASLKATEGGDRADREIPVLPEGRPVSKTRGGTLAGERSFSLTGPDQADPATQELTVRVFPGPLAVLQSEVERLQSGARPDDGAYGFALSTQMAGLAKQASVDLDPKAVRKLQLVAWQRIVHASRSPNAGIASDLLVSLGGTEGHELAEALIPRLVRSVVQGQRGDGTWSRTADATLQQVLVQTAWAARALPPTEEGARLRASGAIERYAPQIEDAYTAAVVLASGLATEGIEERMREILLDAVTEGTDGERSIQVPADVRNAWGYRPSHQEMLAWTILALADRDELTWRLDLAAQLMSGYDARWGFGAGPADTIALQAIATGLPALDQEVQVVLTLDGVEAARATLDPGQPKVPAVLIAQTGGKNGKIGLKTEPAVPGLAFVSTLESWVPWTGQETLPGVDVEASLSRLSVGDTGTLTLTLSAPSNEVLTVEHGLPAGVVVDEEALAASSSRLQRHEVHTDRIRLVTRPFQAGEVIELKIPVQPAFAGTFSTPPLMLQARSGASVYLPPQTWSVGSGAGS